MLAANDLSNKRKAGFLPYLFGGITGISLGLLIVAAVVVMRGSGDTPRIAQADNAPPTYRNVSINENRRNAIVRANMFFLTREDLFPVLGELLQANVC